MSQNGGNGMARKNRFGKNEAKNQELKKYDLCV